MSYSLALKVPISSILSEFSPGDLKVIFVRLVEMDVVYKISILVNKIRMKGIGQRISTAVSATHDKNQDLLNIVFCHLWFWTLHV